MALLGPSLGQYYVLGYYPSSRLCLKCRPVYFSKHKVSETGFCFRLQVKPTQLDPIDRASPYLRRQGLDHTFVGPWPFYRFLDPINRP
jgi:hypothetical protein